MAKKYEYKKKIKKPEIVEFLGIFSHYLAGVSVQVTN